MKIVFLVNDGLFEHFLINKVHENVEIRGIENIQIPFRTHGNVFFRTCYRMYSCVKFKHIFLFLPKILEIHKKGPGGFIGLIGRVHTGQVSNRYSTSTGCL